MEREELAAAKKTKNLIAEKLLQSFNLFCIKYREKYYGTIEAEPHRTEEIKTNMILFNFYLLRMQVDLGFKQFMMQELARAFQTKIDVDTFKKLLTWLIDDIDSSPKKLFNIFSEKTDYKLDLDIEPIKTHIENYEKLTEIRLPEFSENIHKRDIKFLKSLLTTTTKNSTIYNAIEDLIVEYEKNSLYSRYFKPGEIRQHLLFNINRYIESSVNKPFNYKGIPYPQNYFLLLLIPEYYTNEIKIAELFFKALKSFVNIPENLGPALLGHQSIHLMSVLMALLFEDYTLEKKLTILNQIYPYSIAPEDIETIGRDFEQFRDLTLLLPFLKLSQSQVFSGRDYLQWLARILFEQDLHLFSIKIYEYLAKNESDPIKKAKLTDNIATGKRDLGQYAEAIEIYKRLKDLYLKQNLNYSAFLATKNFAFCYNESGQKDEADKIFDQLEKDLLQFKGEELGSVYYNLAVRYRKMYLYEKERSSLELALKNLPLLNPFYEIIQNRLLEMTEFIDPKTGNYDQIRLTKQDNKNYFKENFAKAIAYQNLLNLPLFEYYLERAYSIGGREKIYWKLISINIVLKNEWEKLLDSSNNILKIDAADISGHFFSALFFLYKNNLDQTLKHLLIIFSKTENVLKPGTETEEKITNFLYFLCQKNPDLETIKKFFDYLFSKSSLNDDNILLLILAFAMILVKNSEKELSKYVLWKFLSSKRCVESLYLCGNWCFHFELYNEAPQFYEEALAIVPDNVEMLEKLARTNLVLNNFPECDKNLQKILDITSDSALRQRIEEYQKYVRLMRDTQIRHEYFPISEVKIVFNTVASQLRLVPDVNEIEFGNILTEISKGFEILMAKTFGVRIIDIIRAKYPTIPNSLQKGKKPDILPIDRIFLKFLKNPQDHNPGLGNWYTILDGTLNKIDPKNPVMVEIYLYLGNTSIFDSNMLHKALDITNILLDDRNWASHSKLYTREEVEKILTELTPPINDLLEYLPKI